MARRLYPARFAMAGCAAIVLAGAPSAMAQDEDYEQIVTIMRACSQIEDMAARVTCYDNNIGPRAVTAASPVASALPPRQPPTQADTPTGFGSEMIRQPERTRAEREQREVSARVDAVKELEPGIFLLTLSDGAQWRFVEAAPGSFYPPREGSTIELERGSLGSVFLSYDGQRRLRVRRVQ